MVNNLLLRLREGTVTSVDETDYTQLLVSFINETKREVEDSWNWVQLRTTIQIPTLGDSSTFRYTLTGAGNRYRILQVINDTEDYEMRRVPYKWMNKQFTAGTLQYGSPQFYDVNGNTSGDPNVDLYPIPDAVENINFNMIVPQDDLSLDTDVITVPHWPVLLGAYSKAISERGEDGGQTFAEAERNYMKTLSDAIAIDSSKVDDELIWEVR